MKSICLFRKTLIFEVLLVTAFGSEHCVGRNPTQRKVCLLLVRYYGNQLPESCKSAVSKWSTKGNEKKSIHSHTTLTLSVLFVSVCYFKRSSIAGTEVVIRHHTKISNNKNLINKNINNRKYERILYYVFNS